MSAVAPLPVMLPLIGAACLAAGGLRLRPRRLIDAAAILTALASLAMSLLLLRSGGGGLEVYWFAGWQPTRGAAIGVDFAVDPLNAGMAALAGVLVVAALVFSWHYFEAVGTFYHVLMLVFLAGMCGFALSGDLFNMFVFFELMGVAAYALTAYRSEERGPLQGALNFAVTNSVGAFCILTGLGLLYGRTGALNLAQLGDTLRGRPVDGLVIVAFVLIASGFLVKGAIVPFHLWLADAHAVAPTPACVLFSGVMVELGLYGFARVYWTVFDGALGVHREHVKVLFVVLGLVTVVVGAAMCARQHHLKRLLAFSTISHAGALLVGIALLDPTALGGVAVYVMGHGLVKGALFLCAGIVLNRLGTVDEARLRGRGRELRACAVLTVAGGLALAGAPPFALMTGKGLIDDTARSDATVWILVVLALGSAITAGSVLRAAARIFAGLGRRVEPRTRADRAGDEEEPEVTGVGGRTPAVFVLPAVALLAAAAAVGIWPGLGTAAQLQAGRFEDASAYAAAVMRPSSPGATATPAGAVPGADLTATAVLTGTATAAGALGVAALALWGPRRRITSRLASVVAVPARLQSGHVGDYVTVLVIGVACLGGIGALVLR